MSEWQQAHAGLIRYQTLLQKESDRGNNFGYCLSSASDVRNLFDFHMNLMHPHWCIINRGERFARVQKNI